MGPGTGADSGASIFASGAAGQAQNSLERGVKSNVLQSVLPIAAAGQQFDLRLIDADRNSSSLREADRRFTVSAANVENAIERECGTGQLPENAQRIANVPMPRSAEPVGHRGQRPMRVRA
jgi:L-aminopeptidase/D-esterase-like protein